MWLKGLGFKVLGGLGAKALEFKGLGFRLGLKGFGLKVGRLRANVFRVSALGRRLGVQGLGVQSLGVKGLGFRGSGSRVWKKRLHRKYVDCAWFTGFVHGVHTHVRVYIHMGGCQNYNTAPNIEGTQKGIIILTTTHTKHMHISTCVYKLNHLRSIYHRNPRTSQT